MSKWQENKLGEVLDTIIDNRGRNPASYQEVGVPVIDNFMITNQKNVNLDQAKRFIDDETFDTFIRKYIQPKDILITLVGNGIGNVTQAPEEKSVIIQNTIGLRGNGKIDNDFLFYYLRLYNGKILNLDRGAAQPSVKVGDLKLLKMQLPPLPIQKKVAKILSNYDDLIENNLKRIKLLEELARLTYEEWFLHFRVDGEKLEIDSETSLPFGWEKKKLTDVIDLNPLTTITRDTEQPFIPMGSLSETNMLIGEGEMRIPGGGTRFKNLDTLLARITPSLENGKTGFVQCLKEGEVASGSTEFIVMRATEAISPYYVYPLARTEAFREIAIQSMSGSDGRQRVKVKVFEKIFLNIPTEEIRKKYHYNMKSIFDEIQVLANQNQLLKEARDILLPRLMTGMIDVEDMEIAV